MEKTKPNNKSTHSPIKRYVLQHKINTQKTKPGLVAFYDRLPAWKCAFGALSLLVGRHEGHQACKKIDWWGAGVVICLE